MTPSSSLTRTIASLALVGVLVGGWSSADTNATAPAPTANEATAHFTNPADLSTASLDTPADALVPAKRLRLLNTPIFPMQTTPRCEILDNFGDPRSGGRTHEGSDMLATLGQEVYAVVDGTLTLQVFAQSSSAGASLSGNLWTLTAPNGTYYVYAHLSTFAQGLSKGSAVTQGQVIGYVGDTGNAGPGNYHLHFELHPGGGVAVNPLPLLVIPRECTVY